MSTRRKRRGAKATKKKADSEDSTTSTPSAATLENCSDPDLRKLLADHYAEDIWPQLHLKGFNTMEVLSTITEKYDFILLWSNMLIDLFAIETSHLISLMGLPTKQRL